MSFTVTTAASVAVEQWQRSELHCDELKAKIQLLNEDLHTSKKEFILACKQFYCYRRINSNK